MLIGWFSNPVHYRKIRRPMNALPSKLVALLLFCPLLPGFLPAQSLIIESAPNDAYIDLRWDIPSVCFEDPSNPGTPFGEGVFLELSANGVVIFSTTVLDDPPAAAQSNFRYFAGPGQNVDFELRLYEIGPGGEITAGGCSPLAVSGATLPFQAPESVTASDAASPGAVALSWTNKSKLSSAFQVFRTAGGSQPVLVGTLPGSTVIDSVFAFTDLYSLEDESSLVNGQGYTYCIRTFSEVTGQTFGESLYDVCDEGSTAPIDLQASDDLGADAVALAWNNMGAFADALRLLRDGVAIATLEDEQVTAYVDFDPTYGQASVYTLQILNEADEAIAADVDTGRVGPIGKITGVVRTPLGQVGIPDVKITYTFQRQDTLLVDSALTDFTGRFEFDSLFYGRQGTFELTASKNGLTFENDAQAVELNNQTPEANEVFFEAGQAFPQLGIELELDTFFSLPGIDTLGFNWSFTASVDTVHFQLFRESELIGATVTTDGNLPPLLTDKSAAPGYYDYRLTAYVLRNDSLITASREINAFFPNVSLPTGLTAAQSPDVDTFGILVLDWAHSSPNYAGYRIYRDNQLLAELPVGTDRYFDFRAVPGTGYLYGLTAYRLVDGQTVESELVEVQSPPAVIPPAVEGIVLTALPAANAIEIEWDENSNGNLNFSGYRIYRDAVVIGEVAKGGEETFNDLHGKPGVNYTYDVRTFLEIGDTTYIGPPSLSTPAIDFPELGDAPFSLNPQPGRLGITIDPAGPPVQENFDGYLLQVDGVIRDTLTRGQTRMAIYPNVAGTGSQTGTFSVLAYRNIGGEFFTSPPNTLPYNIPLNNASLEAPGNLEVSDKFPMHIALTWTYPSFKLSRFEISRDGSPVDTLPTSARAYYDYDVAPGLQHEYSVRALYEGNASIPVYGLGQRRNPGVIYGQLQSARNSRSTDSLEVRLVDQNRTVGRAFTNLAGFYRFEDLPVAGLQDNLEVALQTSGQAVDVAIPQQAVPGAPVLNKEVVINFRDDFSPAAYPPAAERDSIARLIDVEAEAFARQGQMVVSWSLSDGRYDGFEVFRELTELAVVRRGEPFFIIDSSGTGGINYDYTVTPFILVNGQRQFGESVAVEGAYPAFAPVENLTATVAYSRIANTLTLNWSHCTGEVGFYQVSRNDEVLALVESGAQLAFIDSTGLPNKQYVYTVQPVRQQGTSLESAPARTVAATFPEVAAPGLSLTALPDSNAVQVRWAYEGEEVSAFRIFRDGALIATLPDTVQQYLDFDGLPQTTHEYKIVALLRRDGMDYQSRGRKSSIAFPILQTPVSLSQFPNGTLGQFDFTWDYYARGIDGFILDFSFNYPDQNGNAIDFDTIYTVPLNGNDYQFSLLDIFNPGDPSSASAVVLVSAYSDREGTRYFSAPVGNSLFFDTGYEQPVPQSFTATDGTFENRVELSWELPLGANIDSFDILRDGQLIATIPAGRRSYTDVYNGIGEEPFGSFDYQIRSVRYSFGQRYISGAAQDAGWPGLLREEYPIFNASLEGSDLGYSVSMFDDKAIVGSPGFLGRGFCQLCIKRNGVWEGLPDLNANTGTTGRFGYSVDIFRERTVTGSPFNSANNGSNSGRADFFLGGFEGNSLPVYVGGNQAIAANRLKGTDVALNGDYGFINLKAMKQIATYKWNPTATQYDLIGYVFQPNPALTVPYPFAPLGLTNLENDRIIHSTIPGLVEYAAMDSDDNHLMIGAGSEFSALFDGFVDVFNIQDNGELMTFVQRIQPEEEGENFGVSISTEGNVAAIGADGKGPGAVYIFTLGDFFWNKAQTIPEPLLPNNSDTDQFGYAVALSGDWLIVGAPEHNDVGEENKINGLVFFFKKDGGGNFNFADFTGMPEDMAGVGDQFGFSVGASSEGFLIGAPIHDNRGAAIFISPDLLEVWNQKLHSASATDSEFTGRTRVAWDFSGNRDYINGFNVYRDDELIHTASPSESFYNDTEGLPGKAYTYAVRVLTMDDRESIPVSDQGTRRGIGVFEGDVVTLMGSAPVPGVQVEASAIIEGERYSYSAQTDVNGRFFIDGVYFADTTVTYQLTAAFRDHEFVTNPIPAAISPQNSTKSNIFFFDRTAFVVQGLVNYEGVNCGLDSIEVMLINHFDDGTPPQEEAVMTDADGRYSLVVNPSLANLAEVEIAIAEFSSSIDNMGAETNVIRHAFRADAPTTITDFDNLPRITTVNFEDTLTYDVELFLTTVCGGPASSNGQFTIEISTPDGCFQTTAITGANGRVTQALPPLEELVFTVTEAAPLTAENALILNYLRYRPSALALKEIHVQNTEEALGAIVLDSLTFQRLVYHRPATITTRNQIGSAFCGDESEPRVIDQDSPYRLYFDVTEFIQGQVCEVEEGVLVVNNAAASANGSRDSLFYQPERGAFEPHDFIAGEPNLVAPFRKGINIKYFSDIGDLLAEVNIPVIVTGLAALPGSDIIVDPNQDESGQVKLPIYVLRDPPGDGSFSSIAENETITKSLSVTNETKTGIGVAFDLTFALFSAGAFSELDSQVGGGRGTEKTSELTFETQQEISTSSDGSFVGPDADVLVGFGASTQYGITERLDYDESTCELNKVQNIEITLNEIETDWFYTVGQIKQLVAENRANAQAALEGDIQLSVGGEPLLPEFAEAEFLKRAANWEQMLEYHAFDTVPFYQFCNQSMEQNRLWQDVVFYGQEDEYLQSIGTAGEEAILVDPQDPPGTFQERVENAIEARNGFCLEIGSYDENGKFLLTNAEKPADVLFTSDLALLYEEAVFGVNLWLDSLYLDTDQVNDRIESFGSDTQEGLFPEIENSTFSAGVDITKTTTQQQVTSSTISQFAFLEVDFKIGNIVGTNANVGVGLVVESVDVENKIGVRYTLDYQFNRSRYESTTTSTEVSYTLSDDDPGDQFSVTAIKGRDPGHSPYFQLLGGRSSCPPEPGSIFRDRFDLSLYDQETNSAFDFQELQEVDPDENATFYLQLTNLNPFGEQRDLYLYHEAESNENGAVLITGGQYLGGGNEDGLAYTFINPNQPFIIPLELERPVNSYQFDSIFVVMRPSCTDGDLYLGFERDTVTISAFFDHPCSDISVTAPEDGWIIRRRNPFLPNSQEAIAVEIRDYDPENPLLEEVYLQYRRVGDGSGWQDIPPIELDGIDRNPTAADLLGWNEANFGPGQAPFYPFIWDITENYSKYPDGEYEIRAISACGAGGIVQSNVTRGQIRRQTEASFAQFEPADRIWQQGDEVSIRVSRELDFGRLAEMNFLVVNEATQDTVPGQVAPFPADNKIVFIPDQPSLTDYDDQELTIKVWNLIDEVGNRFPVQRDAAGNPIAGPSAQNQAQLDTFQWEFLVIARDIYAQDTLLETVIYQDREGSLSTVLFNTNTNGLIDYTIQGLADFPWLEAEPAAGSIFTATGLPIRFAIDGSMLPVGDTSAVLEVVSSSTMPNQGSDQIRINVKVLARPPFWGVDPSQYTTSNTVIANYRFSDAPVAETSRDSMDIVSAWIGNEIRGVANISSTTAGQYASFMLVYGDPDDFGQPLEFRVWDASAGIEYNAYPADTLFFGDGFSAGTFAEPEVLVVDKARDRARYIPVNGQGDGGGGITWLSFNNEEANMSVDAQLRELKHLQNGDILKTENTSAGYVEGIGWVSTNGLDTIRPEEGYILFLGGIDDTIRVTGRDATYGPIPLADGWNLIGYPLPDTVGINDALSGLLNVSNLDLIRTVAQDPTLPGLSANMVAQFDTGTSEWLFGNLSGMEVLRPNFAYQIEVGEEGPLLYPGSSTPLSAASVTDGQPQPVMVAFDPSDPDTWSVDPSAYPSSMVVTSALYFEEAMSFDEGDKVAAYVNGECRGVAPVSYVQALESYRAPLFVYGAQAGEDVQFLLYDASGNQVYLAKEQLEFEPNGIFGSFTGPFSLNAQLMSAVYEQNPVYCAADTMGAVSVAMVSGLEPPYSYLWSTGAEASGIEGIGAGDYGLTITGANGLSYADTISLENLEVEIPAPTVELSAESPACRGTDVVLYAHAPNQESSIIWATAEGEPIQDNPALLVENIQSAYTALAKTIYRGCESPPSAVAVEVYEPDASFTVSPTEELTTATAIQFLPSVTQGAFVWAFGDGQSSTSTSPAHHYELPGHYQAVLSRTDLAGCTGQGLFDIWVSAATQVLELPEGELRLQASPNPFQQHIDVNLQLPYGGAYTLELLSLSGQRIEHQKRVWEAGPTSVRLLPEVPDGTYLLRLESGRGHQLALPIVKQTPRP